MFKKNIVILLVIGVLLLVVIFFLVGIINNGKKKVVVKMDKTFVKKTEEIFSLGKKWLKNNLQEDGSFVYLYSVDGKIKEHGKKGIIRQLLTFRVVAQLCTEGDNEMCQLHKNNLRYIFNDSIYKTLKSDGKEFGCIMYNGASSLGANAMALRTLVASPYFNQYQTQVKAIKNTIVGAQQSDGSFQPYIIRPQVDFNYERAERFYSGEALLALLEYYEKTRDMEVLEIAKKGQEYYLTKYVTNIESNYYPAYVPWQTLSLAKLYQITNDKKYAEAVFTMNDKLLSMQTADGHFYDANHPDYGRAHSASDGVYSESLAEAYKIAIIVNDRNRQKKYLSAIKKSINNLAGLQFCNQYSNINVDKESRICGGIQTVSGSDRARVDSLGHTMDFIIRLKNDKL